MHFSLHRTDHTPNFKTRIGLFKIAGFRRWMVFFSGSELIDDVRKASDDVLSGKKSIEEVRWCVNGELIIIWIIQFFQSEYTLKVLNANDKYSTDIVRSQLTRNIAVTFEEVREEITMAIEDLIPTCEDSAWKVLGEEAIPHKSCRVGQSPLSRYRSTRNLSCYKSYFRWSSSMFVIFSCPFSPFGPFYLILFYAQAEIMTIRI